MTDPREARKVSFLLLDQALFCRLGLKCTVVDAMHVRIDQAASFGRCYTCRCVCVQLLSVTDRRDARKVMSTVDATCNPTRLVCMVDYAMQVQIESGRFVRPLLHV